MIEIEKLGRVMRELARDKGPFTLFGLFHREGAPHDKWDLVVSAPWLEHGRMKALNEFVEKLSSVVRAPEILSLSRVVRISPDNPGLEAVLRSFPVDDGPVVVRDTTLFGLSIREAFILRAMRPPEPALSGREGGRQPD